MFLWASGLPNQRYIPASRSGEGVSHLKPQKIMGELKMNFYNFFRGLKNLKVLMLQPKITFKKKGIFFKLLFLVNIHIYLRWPRWMSTFASNDPLNAHIYLRLPPWMSHSPHITTMNVHIHLRWHPLTSSCTWYSPWMSTFFPDDPPECPHLPQMTPLILVHFRWLTRTSTLNSYDPLNIHIHLIWSPWTSIFTSDDPPECPHSPQMTPLNFHWPLRWPPECPHSPQMAPLNVHFHLSWPPWMSKFTSGPHLHQLTPLNVLFYLPLPAHQHSLSSSSLFSLSLSNNEFIIFEFIPLEFIISGVYLSPEFIQLMSLSNHEFIQPWVYHFWVYQNLSENAPKQFGLLPITNCHHINTCQNRSKQSFELGCF